MAVEPEKGLRTFYNFYEFACLWNNLLQTLWKILLREHILNKFLVDIYIVV